MAPLTCISIADDGYAIDNIVVVPYPDREPPVFRYFGLTPHEPNSTESVLVNVNVIDTSDVDTVILSYYNGATWFNITMTGTEPDYEGTIPALPGGTVVQYRFYANDTIGNWGISEIKSYIVIPVPTPTPIPSSSTTTPTTPPPPPPPLDPIIIGGGVAVVVIVLAIIILRRR
ncbi:MAG: hypothetical protein ACXADF_18270 [Candidatus Thorarchaeota archaeon]|jgi:hypothetical protein